MAILSVVVAVMSSFVGRAERWLLRWKLPILIAALAVAGAACGTSNDKPGTHVRVAIGGQTQMVYLPTTLAQELGFYKAEGLDVELQDFEGGAKALQALIGGSADVVSGFYDHTIQMAAEGRPMTAFVVMLRYPGLVLVTSPQAAGRLTSLSALKGGIAGVTTPGSSSQLFLNVLLAKHGVPRETVSAVAIGSGATAVAALERGRVDAGWIGDPGLTILRRRNPGVRTLADLRDERGTHEAFGTASYPSAVLYTSAAWLQTNRDTAAALSRAIVQTLRWMQEHSDMEIAQKTPPAIRGEDLELFAEAFKNSRAMFSVDGLMPAEGAAAVRDVLAASNPKVKSSEIDLPDTYTNDLVNPR
jgi:NitT/TauT family transport system substrate-binding protein